MTYSDKPNAVYERKRREDPKVREALNRSHRERMRADPCARMLYTAKARAKKQGLAFNITRKDIEPLPTHCPVLGVRLRSASNGKSQPNSYSLDRISPRMGYVQGNVAVISHRANQIKNDGTLKELKALIRWLTKIQRSKP